MSKLEENWEKVHGLSNILSALDQNKPIPLDKIKRFLDNNTKETYNLFEVGGNFGVERNTLEEIKDLLKELPKNYEYLVIKTTKLEFTEQRFINVES